MTDEIKAVETEASKFLAETKATIGSLGDSEAQDVTWIKAHWLVIVGATAFVLGWATRFIHL
jgi:uncharacterized membrane protein YphA (DoxX/SURF4 family)